MTPINNPPPTITTYEEHLFESLVGDLIAKAKNKEEKADAYTSALVMCSTLKQVEHAYKNGADLSSEKAFILLEKACMNFYGEQEKIIEFILKHAGDKIIKDNINDFFSYHKRMRIALYEKPKFASLLSKTKIDWADVDKVNYGKKNEFKKFCEGNTLLLNMARKAPRSVIHLLKSKHTFSTHPKEKTKILKEMTYTALQNICNEKYTPTSPSKKPYLALFNFIVDELKKENVNYNTYLDPLKLPSWLKQESNGKWIIDMPKQKPVRNIEKIKRKKNKSLDDLKFLVSKNIDITKIDPVTNDSYLGWAMYFNNHIGCKFLFENGANPNQESPLRLMMREGDTLFHSLCTQGSPSLISLFIENGADLNAENDAGQTPVFSAVNSANIKGLKTLIENGVDLNKMDNQGQTPIFYLFKFPPKLIIDILEVMIHNGADPLLKNKEDKTFIEYLRRLQENSLNKALKDFMISISSYQLKENIKSTSKKIKRKI